MPLSQEIELIRTYLGVEETRFRDRLSTRIDVAEGVGQALVPNLLLQPLVENALRHGIAPLGAGGTVEIAARRLNGVLEITVRDDGAGLGASGEPIQEGVGLSNTRRRLEALYGEDHTFEIRSPKEGGTTVTVTFPYRPDTTTRHPDEAAIAPDEAPSEHDEAASGPQSDPAEVDEMSR